MQVIDAEDSLFGSIILDVGHKDIYSSFDAWLNLEIEGFRAPNVNLCRSRHRSNHYMVIGRDLQSRQEWLDH